MLPIPLYRQAVSDLKLGVNGIKRRLFKTKINVMVNDDVYDAVKKACHSNKLFHSLVCSSATVAVNR